jgi:hypothetical protein
MTGSGGLVAGNAESTQESPGVSGCNALAVAGLFTVLIAIPKIFPMNVGRTTSRRALPNSCML